MTDGRERLRSGNLTAAEAALREALSIDSTAALALAFQREFQQARRSTTCVNGARWRTPH